MVNVSHGGRLAVFKINLRCPVRKVPGGAVGMSGYPALQNMALLMSRAICRRTSAVKHT